MKKHLPKILIPILILAIFLAPVSGGVEMNEVKAQEETRRCYNEDFFYKDDIKTAEDCSKPGYEWMTGAEAAAALALSRQKDPSKKFCFNSSGSSTSATTKADCLKTTGNVWRTAAEQKAQEVSSDTGSSYFDCSGILPWSDISCKIASLIYFVVFQPMAAFTWLSAKLLDFFVYYSTNSNSYNSEFVNKAWAAVRDIANIFFIIALLYIAIKTILGLNVTDNKKLISAVILVALIINFSLFTTKLVIDGSNILAKVFYNNIIPIDETGKTLTAGSGGQKSISVGLVKQFDPQTIFSKENFKNHEGLFIFVTILSILLMGFMIYIFLSVALLFVARVISLWLSMIFSPIAFASYTVPFDIPGFGHKEWWSELTKNALLAPIFIFFLYIIILFGDALKSIPYDVSGTTSDVGGYLDAAMKTIIPFVIIYILLRKAKELAVKYSGEIGAGINKIGAMAGGLALGAATGGTAMLGRAAIGGGGGWAANKLAIGANKLGDTKWGNRLGMNKLASGLTSVGAFAQKSSFDVRGVKFAGQSLASVTGLKVGEAQKGGIAQTRKEKVEKRQKRADMLKVREDEGLKQKLNNSEIDLQTMLNKVTKDFGIIDRELESLRKAKADTATGSKEEKDIANKIEALNQAKKDVRNGEDTTYTLDDGKTWKDIKGVKVESGINTGKTMKEMASQVIPDQKEAMETETRRRKVAFANRKGNWGMLSSTANKEARHKIIMGEKLPESGAKA